MKKGILTWLHPSLRLHMSNDDQSPIAEKIKQKTHKGDAIDGGRSNSVPTASLSLFSCYNSVEERPTLALGTLGLELLTLQPPQSHHAQKPINKDVDKECVRVVMNGKSCLLDITNDNAKTSKSFQEESTQVCLLAPKRQCSNILANLLPFRRKNEIKFMRQNSRLAQIFAFRYTDRAYLSKLKRLFFKNNREMTDLPHKEEKRNASGTVHVISAALPCSKQTGYLLSDKD